MAPYSPPTGGRADKLRLDFNENTVGCSPARDRVPEGPSGRGSGSAIYPEYGEAKAPSAPSFSGATRAVRCSPTAPTKPFRFSSTPMWMMAMRSSSCSRLTPCTGSTRRSRARRFARSTIRSRTMEFPLEELLDAIQPDTRADHDRQSRTIPPAPGVASQGIERILEARPQGRRADR